jgi:CRP-like cAMP-binding protein
MVYLMGNDAQRRLLLELVISAERFGEKRPHGVFIAVHEGELATRVGLARETASRALKVLKTKGVLRVTKDGMEIADLEAVRSQLVT